MNIIFSLATGEPPLCMSLTLIMALRQALISARKDAGLSGEWFLFSKYYEFCVSLLIIDK